MTFNWRDKLLALRVELESAAEIGDDSTAVVELDQSMVGRLSRMDALQAQAMAKAARQRREAKLVRITAALERVSDGSFGICEQCDEAINPKRLEFDPTVTLCIGCASAAEST